MLDLSYRDLGPADFDAVHATASHWDVVRQLWQLAVACRPCLHPHTVRSIRGPRLRLGDRTGRAAGRICGHDRW